MLLLKRALWILKCLIPASCVFVASVICYRPSTRLEVSEVGPVRLLYRAHLGPYSEVDGVIDQVREWAARHSIPCRATFGEYFDDSTRVAAERLRSNGGCWIEDPYVELPALDSGFSVRVLDRARFLVARSDDDHEIVYDDADGWFVRHGGSLSLPSIEVYRKGLPVEYVLRMGMGS